MARRNSDPQLPKFIQGKIYKTGQTRGADDDVIYQNRVSRNSTVLIPYDFFEETLRQCQYFENGFIVLLDPQWYFTTQNVEQELSNKGLYLGVNCLVFYQRRMDWLAYPILPYWTHPASRQSPLGGQYIARIAATTALENGERINLGYTFTSLKGAGIRVYEYASSEQIQATKIQLEAIFWLCIDSIEAVTSSGMSLDDANLAKNNSLNLANVHNLLDFKILRQQRILDADNHTVCPLCLEKISAFGFMNKILQVMGRRVHDLTVTEINLFHIQELRPGQFNHRVYNLGWGHHHCNTVVKDSGIFETLDWMRAIIGRNDSI